MTKKEEQKIQHHFIIPLLSLLPLLVVVFITENAAPLGRSARARERVNNTQPTCVHGPATDGMETAGQHIQEFPRISKNIQNLATSKKFTSKMELLGFRNVSSIGRSVRR